MLFIMVDVTFVFLLVTTVGLGIRSLLDTYTARELIKRLGAIVALSFVVLISVDLSILQGGAAHGAGAAANGPSSASQWSSVNLPPGFGPGGMSLPPWNPYAVEQDVAGGRLMPPVAAGVAYMGHGGALSPIGAVPPLGGMPAAVGAGYYPGAVPGMAGSFVPGGLLPPRPEPTKPPPRPLQAPPPDPVAAQALEKLTLLLERQMDRLDEREAEQKRALSKSFKQNVKLSGDLYKLTKDGRKRIDRVAQLEEHMQALSKETELEIAKLAKRERSAALASRPLYGWDAERAKAHDPSAGGAANGTFAGGPTSAAFLAEIERKIDALMATSGHGGGSGDGGGASGGSGGGASTKALRSAKAEVERLRLEAEALRSGKRGAELTLEQLQAEVVSLRTGGGGRSGDIGAAAGGTKGRSAGAFAVLANTDEFSIKAALAVCHMLVHHRSQFDVLVITPTRMEQSLADAVRQGGCHPTTLGLAPYPPKFAPMRPSFRVCWHKLRLFLLTQYQAIVALDSDIVILNNIDELVTKVGWLVLKAAKKLRDCVRRGEDCGRWKRCFAFCA